MRKAAAEMQASFLMRARALRRFFHNSTRVTPLRGLLRAAMAATPAPAVAAQPAGWPSLGGCGSGRWSKRREIRDPARNPAKRPRPQCWRSSPKWRRSGRSRPRWMAWPGWRSSRNWAQSTGGLAGGALPGPGVARHRQAHGRRARAGISPRRCRPAQPQTASGGQQEEPPLRGKTALPSANVRTAENSKGQGVRPCDLTP